MKIDKLIEELTRIQQQHGNIEVTCTASLQQDAVDLSQDFDRPYESTVENLIVREPDKTWKFGKRVRLYW